MDEKCESVKVIKIDEFLDFKQILGSGVRQHFKVL